MDAQEVIKNAKQAALDLEHVLLKEGVTGKEIRQAAEPFDEIKSEIVRLLKEDG